MLSCSKLSMTFSRSQHSKMYLTKLKQFRRWVDLYQAPWPRPWRVCRFSGLLFVRLSWRAVAPSLQRPAGLPNRKIWGISEVCHDLWVVLYRGSTTFSKVYHHFPCFPIGFHLPQMAKPIWSWIFEVKCWEKMSRRFLCTGHLALKGTKGTAKWFMLIICLVWVPSTPEFQVETFLSIDLTSEWFPSEMSWRERAAFVPSYTNVGTHGTPYPNYIGCFCWPLW